jgi:outer membrane protein assembly factor BamB
MTQHVRERTLRCALAAVLASLMLATSCSGDDGSSDSGGSSDDVTSAPAASDAWPTAGADFNNSRADPGFPLNASNVEDLDIAWTAELEGAAALSTVPIISDGVVYTGTGSGYVFATDLDTGEEIWKSEATGFNIGPFGVAVDDERVYTLNGATGVAALERETGKVVWKKDVVATPTTGVDIQPIVVDGLVIISSVPITPGGIYAPGDRGVVYALDSATGEIKWSFDTVEGDMWGHPEVNSGGGAWYPPAVDTEAGVVYVGVANPAPFPGTAEFPTGSSRPGPNLYTDSVVALDLHTGELLWYHQVLPHDIFDRDQVHTMIVNDTIVSAGKSGIVVGVDPADGTRLWEQKVGLHKNDDLTELDGPTEIAPGTFGGILTPPASADGVIYAPVVNAPTELKPNETAYFGAELGQMDGEVVAIDASDGSVLWSTKVPGDPLGGTAVVGDLVLTALLDGFVVALDRETGEIVHSIELDGGINGWMSTADGKIIVPVGQAETPMLVALTLT